ncbi:MAG: bifunctional oligoribonuclease/PAP phosphatase NrnA [Salibacter sp.]|uniref:DHH family phosphoesterase n=1 Tax=Salibacter sp. TaxID=2010995 RepID=UPI002870595C|nr:bifunctional oligoribonuclease/PAP phosphatase NrnA [Salibacter sp.]MDR9398070.1 bifunctional oligoribonuclease/PAP phosphatase NrnA [Salibacter sp.]
MTEGDYLHLHDILNKPQKIAITMHKSPDGDAVGSALGLFHYLKLIGQQDVTIVAPDPYPNFLNWLPGSDEIMVYTEQEEEAKSALKRAEYIFSLDYNNLNRTGDLTDILVDSDACFIMVDHHQEPDEFAEFVLSKTSASSTAELIYELIKNLEFDQKLTLNSAQALYTGILTDTGGFRFNSTSAITHRIAAEFIELGLKPHVVYDRVFDQNKLSKLRLMGYVLNDKLKVVEENAAYFALSQDELRAYDYQKGDTEGLVNYGLSIKGVVFSTFMRESSEGFIKISFRSKGDFDVNKFAREHFEGGGHINAAGGKSDLSLQETIDKLEALIKEVKLELSQNA